MIVACCCTCRRLLVLIFFLGNHKKMLLATGYKAENIKEYRYFDNATKSLDFDGLCADLEVFSYNTAFTCTCVVIRFYSGFLKPYVILQVKTWIKTPDYNVCSIKPDLMNKGSTCRLMFTLTLLCMQ